MMNYFLPSRKLQKKYAAVLFSAMYIQVNIAWAGVPTLPLFTTLKTLFLKPAAPNEIFIFHSPRPWEDIVLPKQTEQRTPDRIEKEQRKESVNAIAISGQSAKHISDLPEGPIKTELQNVAGGNKNAEIKNITYTQLMTAVQKAGVVLSADQKSQLSEAFGKGQALNLTAHKGSSGEVVFYLNNSKNGGSLVINQRFIGAPEISIQPKAPAAKPSEKSSEPSVTFTAPPPSAVRSAERAEAARNTKVERAVVGKTFEVGGLTIRLKVDSHTKQLVAVDAKSGKHITDAVFTAKLPDANGKTVDVKYVIDHFEVQNGQVVAKGAMQVGEGEKFKDGKVGAEKADAGAGSSREFGGTESHNLHVTVQSSGQILFEGKKGGGEIPFTAAVAQTETGTDLAMDQAQFNPITAGAHDITVTTELGAVIAEAGRQGQIYDGKANTYQYSVWTVAKNDAATSDFAQSVLNHFGISETQATLVNKDGFNVGRVVLNESKGATQIIGLNTPAGKEALSNLLVAKQSGSLPNIELAVTGSQGRAFVVRNGKGTVDQGFKSAEKLENITLKGVSAADARSSIDNSVQRILRADPGIASYVVNSSYDMSGKSYGIQISGVGQNGTGKISTPLIRSLDKNASVNEIFNSAIPITQLSDAGLGLDAQVESSNITVRVNTLTGQVTFNNDGNITFKNEAKGFTGSATVSGGQITEVRFASTARGAAEIAIGKTEGTQPHHTLTLPSGQSVTFDVRTEKLSGDVGGVVFRIPSTNFQVALEKVGNKIEPRIEGNLTSFGKEVDTSKAIAAWTDGRLTFQLPPESAVKLDNSIVLQVPEGDQSVPELDQVQLVQVSLDLLSGSSSGVGSARVNMPTLVPNGPNGPDGQSASSETLPGADSHDIKIETVKGEGTLVTPLNGDARLNIAIRESNAVQLKEGGPLSYLGQAQVVTSHSKNIEIGAGGATVMGRNFDAGWKIDKISDVNFTLTSLKNNTSFTLDGTNVVINSHKADTTLHFEQGQLKNTSDLTNISVQKGTTRIYFEPEVGNENRTIPVLSLRSDMALSFGETSLGIKDFVGETKGPVTGVIRGRWEGGAILFNLAQVKTIDGINAVQVKNLEEKDISVPTSELLLSSVGLDLSSGKDAGSGSFRLSEGSFVMKVAAPHASSSPTENMESVPNTTAKELAEPVGSQSLYLEDVWDNSGKVVGMRVASRSEYSQVNSVFVVGQDDKGKVSIAAQPNPISSYATSLYVGENGLTSAILGIASLSKGISIDTGDLAKGQYSLHTSRGDTFTFMKSGITAESKGFGKTFFQNGQIVLKTTTDNDKSPFFTTKVDNNWVVKDQEGVLVFTSHPTRMSGSETMSNFDRGGHTVVLRISNGEPEIMSADKGVRIENNSDRAALITTDAERGQFVEVGPNSNAFYTGFESLLASHAFVGDRGVLTYQVGSFHQDRMDLAQQLTYSKGEISAFSKITNYVDGQALGSPTVVLQESRQTRDDGAVTSAVWKDNSFQIRRIDIKNSTEKYDTFQLLGSTIKLGGKGQVVYTDVDLYQKQSNLSRPISSLLIDGGQVVTGRLNQNNDSSSTPSYTLTLGKLDASGNFEAQGDVIVTQRHGEEGYVIRTAITLEPSQLGFSAQGKRELVSEYRNTAVSKNTAVVHSDESRKALNVSQDMRTGAFTFESGSEEFDFQGNHVTVSKGGNDVSTQLVQSNIGSKVDTFTNSGFRSGEVVEMSEIKNTYMPWVGRVLVSGLVVAQLDAGGEKTGTYFITDHKRVNGNTFAIASGSSFTEKRGGNQITFSNGTALLANRDGDRILAGEGKREGGQFQVGHTFQPGGTSGDPIKITDRSSQIEIIDNKIYVTSGRVEIGEENGSNFAFIRAGTYLTNTAVAENHKNHAFIVNGDGSFSGVMEVSLSQKMNGSPSDKQERALLSAVQEKAEKIKVANDGYSDEIKQSEGKFGKTFIVFVDGVEKARYQVGASHEIGGGEGDLTRGVLTLNARIQNTESWSRGDVEAGGKNGFHQTALKTEFRVNEEGDYQSFENKESIRTIASWDQNLNNYKESTAALNFEREKTSLSGFEKKSETITLRKGTDGQAVTYDAGGFFARQHLKGSARQGAVESIKEDEVQATKDMEEYIQTGRVAGKLGDAAITYLLEGSAEAIRQYLPEHNYTFGLSDLVGFNNVRSERELWAATADKLAGSLGDAVTLDKLNDTLIDASNDNAPGFWRSIDTAPLKVFDAVATGVSSFVSNPITATVSGVAGLYNTVVKHPIESAAFAATMAVMIWFPPAVAAAPWISGASLTSVGGYVFTAAQAFNFASITNHIVHGSKTGDYGGVWLGLDIAFAFLPAGLNFFNYYVRGGKEAAQAFKAVAQTEGLSTTISIPMANEFASGGRVLGVVGSQDEFVQAIRQAVRNGITTGSEFSKAAQNVKLLAKSGMDTGLVDSKSFLGFKWAPRTELHRLWNQAVKAAEMTGVGKGITPNLVRFLETAVKTSRDVGFVRFGELVSRGGVQNMASRSGRAFQQEWARSQLKSILEGAAKPEAAANALKSSVTEAVADLSQATHVTGAIQAYAKAGTQGADLVRAIMGNQNLVSPAEKLFVLGRLAESPDSFIRLGRQLVTELKSEALLPLLKPGSEGSAVVLHEMIKGSAESGKVIGGFLSALTKEGGEVAASVFKGGNVARFAQLLKEGGGAGFGQALASFLNRGGSNAALFINRMFPDTFQALGRASKSDAGKFLESLGAVLTHQDVETVKNFVTFLDKLSVFDKGATLATLLETLKSDGLSNLFNLIKTDGASLTNLWHGLPNSNLSTRIIRNLSEILNSGGTTATNFLKNGASAEVLAYLKMNDTELLGALFKGAANATNGAERILSLGAGRFGSLIKVISSTEKTQIVEAFAKGFSTAERETYSFVLNQLKSGEMGTLATAFSAGGSAGVANIFSTLKGLSETQAKLFIGVIGSLSKTDRGLLQGILQLGLSGGGANVRIMLSVLEPVAQKQFFGRAVSVISSFIHHAGLSGPALLASMKSTTAEYLAYGMRSLVKNMAANPDSLWKSVFKKGLDIALKNKNLGAEGFGKMVGELFNASGKNLTKQIENLGASGAVKAMGDAFADMATKGAWDKSGSVKSLFGLEAAAKAPSAPTVNAIVTSRGISASLEQGGASLKSAYNQMGRKSRDLINKIFSSTSETGRQTLLKTLENGSFSQDFLRAFENVGDDVAKTLGAILGDEASAKSFINILSGTVGEGTINLRNLIQIIKDEKGVAFFKNVVEAGGSKLSSFLNLISPENLSTLTKILSDSSPNVVTAFAELLSAGHGNVLVSFLQTIKDSKTFISFLNSMDRQGLDMLKGVLKSVDWQGARFLGELINSNAGTVHNLLSGLKNEGAERFGALISGSLTENIQKGIQSLVTALDGKGTNLFAQILNTSSRVETLKSLFEALGEKGGSSFGKLLNELAGTSVEKKFVNFVSSLNGGGVKAFGQALNGGRVASANFKVLMMDLNKNGSQVLLNVFNTLDEAGGKLFAQALGSENLSIKNFTQLLSDVAKNKGEVLGGVFNRWAGSLSEPQLRNSLSTLLAIFSDSTQVKTLTKLINILEKIGGENLGLLLQMLSGEKGAGLGLLKGLSSKNSLQGMAGFLNNAKEKVVRRLSTLFQENMGSREGVLRILGAGSEAGQGLARLIEAGIPVSSFNENIVRLFSNQSNSSVLGDVLRVLGSGEEKGASLLARAISTAKPEDMTSLLRLFEEGGKHSWGGDALGRLFQVLGEKGVQPEFFLERVSLIANARGSLGEKMGALLRAAYSKEGKLAADSYELEAAFQRVVGTKPGEGFVGRTISRFKGVHAPQLMDAAESGALLKGLFNHRNSLGAKAFAEASEAQLMKDVVKTLLGNKGGLTRLQRNALRDELRQMGDLAEDLLDPKLLAKELPGSESLRAALSAPLNFGQRRLDYISYLIQNPDVFARMSAVSSLGWAGFGFSGASVVTPFGYDPDYINDDGKLVNGEGWYLWRFFDPVQRYSDGRRVELKGGIFERWGKAWGITLGRWDGEYMTWRLRSAREMFEQGRVMGPLLHIVSFQPGGAWGRALERGVGGNVTRVAAQVGNFSTRLVGNLSSTLARSGLNKVRNQVVRVLGRDSAAQLFGWPGRVWSWVAQASSRVAGATTRFTPPFIKSTPVALIKSTPTWMKTVGRVTSSVVLGVGGLGYKSTRAIITGNIPVLDTGFQGLFTQLVGRFISPAAATSLTTRAMGTMLLGWESVLPFHIISQLGTGLGTEIAAVYYTSQGLTDDEAGRQALGVGEIVGFISMFLVPMGQFSQQGVKEVLELGTQSAPDTFAFQRAREVAHAILEAPSPSSTGRPVYFDITVGRQTLKMEARSAQALLKEASRMAISSLSNAHEVNNRGKLSIVENVQSALALTKDKSSASAGGAQLAQLRSTIESRSTDPFFTQLSEALNLKGEARDQKVESLRESVLPGTRNKFLSRLDDALGSTGEGRDKSLSRLMGEQPELLNFKFDHPVFVQTLRTHLVSELKVSLQQIAEAGTEGRLTERAKFLLNERIDQDLTGLSIAQLKELVGKETTAEIRGLTYEEARTRLEELQNTPVSRNTTEAEVKDMLIAKNEISIRVERSTEKLLSLYKSVITSRAEKEAKADYFYQGKKVDSNAPGAIKITSGMKTLAEALHTSAILSEYRDTPSNQKALENLAEAPIGSRTATPGSMWGLRAGKLFVVTEKIHAQAQILVESKKAEQRLVEIRSKAEKFGDVVKQEILDQATELERFIGTLKLPEGSKPIGEWTIAELRDKGFKLKTENLDFWEQNRIERKEAIKNMKLEAARELLLKKLEGDKLPDGVDAKTNSANLQSKISRMSVEEIKAELTRRVDKELGEGGLGSLSVEEFLTREDSVVNRIKANSSTAKDVMLVLEFAGILDSRLQGQFNWTKGQLFGVIRSADGSINMAAGAGKTLIMMVRALVEAVHIDTARGGNETAVMMIAENPSSVDNLLGVGKAFDVGKIGEGFGIQVIDLRKELEFVRKGEKDGEFYSINDVNRLLQGGTGQAEHRVRRIVVIDFDTLGGALSEFKAQGFLRAFTETQVRLFDEVHRVTTDPVTYVIGESGGKRAHESPAYNFKGLRALEEKTVALEGEKNSVGLINKETELRIRGIETGIKVYRNESAWKAAGESVAAVFLDGATNNANANKKAEELLQRAAGSKLNGAEIISFLRGRLTEENYLDTDITLVHDALVDGNREKQYRPIQRGLGEKESQVIEDVAYLMGMNSRRAELNRGGKYEITYKEDSGQFQILETIRGISRYEFFERSGGALAYNKLRGFTATAEGFEGFIRMATGAEVVNTVINEIGTSIKGLRNLEISRTRAEFYTALKQRVLSIADKGTEVYEANTAEFKEGSGLKDQKRQLIGTEDAQLARDIEQSLVDAGYGERLYSKQYVWDKVLGRAVEAATVNVEVKGQGYEYFVVDKTSRAPSTRYDVVKRVINNKTSEAQIQTIVKSFSEEDAIVISNQRGLTGKNFQEIGTVLLADMKLTVAEAIQNLERLGRTKEKDSTKRWEVRRELFLNQSDLLVQLQGAYGKKEDYLSLLNDRVDANLTKSETRDVLREFFNEVAAKKNSMTEDAAVASVIEEWSKSDNLPRRQALLRMNLELNLLIRNTSVAKTVAYEVWFHHDLGRALGEGFHASRNNPTDVKILEKFEQDFRQEKQRSTESSFEGKLTASAEEQLKSISGNSRHKSLSLLSQFMSSDGMKLSGGVRRIFERQLAYLRAVEGIEFKDAINHPILNQDSFASMGREKSSDGKKTLSAKERFVESRSLVFQRLKNDIAPAADSTRETSRQVAQVIDQLKDKKVSASVQNKISEVLSQNSSFSFEDQGVRFLTKDGERYVEAITQTLELLQNPQNFSSLFAASRLMGDGRGSLYQQLSRPIGWQSYLGIQLNYSDLNAEEKSEFSFNLIDSLRINQIFDFSEAKSSNLSAFVRVGDLAKAHDNVIGNRVLSREALIDILRAEVPKYSSIKEGLAKQSKNTDSKLETAQQRAPVQAFMTWMVGSQAPRVDSDRARDLRQQEHLLVREQQAAQALVQSLIVPSYGKQFMNAYLLMPLQKGLAKLKETIWSGHWLAKTGKITLLAGVGVAAGWVASSVGLVTMGALKIVGFGAAGLIGTVIVVKQFGQEMKLARVQNSIQNQANDRVLAQASDKLDTTTVLARSAVFGDGQIGARASVIKLLTLLTELGAPGEPVRARLKYSDVLTLTGQQIRTFGALMGQPKDKPGATDFRKAVREWLGVTSKTRFDIRIPKVLAPVQSVLSSLIKVTPTLVSLSPVVLMFLGVHVSMVGMLTLGLSGSILSKLVGVPNPMTAMFKKMPGMDNLTNRFTKNKPTIQPLKDTFLGRPLLSDLSHEFGAQGAPELLRILVKFNAWERTREQEKIEKDGKDKRPDNDQLQKLLRQMQGGAKEEESEEEPLYSLARFASEFSPKTRGLAFTLAGYTKEEVSLINQRASQLTMAQSEANGYAKKISLDDLARPDFDMVLKIHTLDFDTVKKSLATERQNLTRGSPVESLPGKTYQAIAQNLQMDEWQVRAIDGLLQKQGTSQPTPQMISEVANDQGAEVVQVSDFLYRSLGLKPVQAQQKLSMMESLVRDELHLSKDQADNMMWSFRRTINTTDIKNFKLIENTAGDHTKEAKKWVVRMAVALMRGSIEYVVDGVTLESAHHQFLYGATKEGQPVLGFYRQLGEYIAQLPDEQKVELKNEFKKAYSGVDHVVPWAFVGTAESIAYDLEKMHTSIILSDVASQLKEKGKSKELKMLVEAIDKGEVKGTLESVLKRYNLADSQDFKPYQRYLVIGDIVRSVVRELEWPIQGISFITNPPRGEEPTFVIPTPDTPYKPVTLLDKKSKGLHVLAAQRAEAQPKPVRTVARSPAAVLPFGTDVNKPKQLAPPADPSTPDLRPYVIPLPAGMEVKTGEEKTFVLPAVPPTAKLPSAPKSPVDGEGAAVKTDNNDNTSGGFGTVARSLIILLFFTAPGLMAQSSMASSGLTDLSSLLLAGMALALTVSSFRGMVFSTVRSTFSLLGFRFPGFTGATSRARGTELTQVLSIPSESGTMSLQFQSERSFAQTFLASPQDKTERIFVRTVDTIKGVTVIGEGRELRQLTLVNSPDYETGALRQFIDSMTQLSISVEPRFSANTVHTSAMQAMDELLSDPITAGWTQDIQVAGILSNARAQNPTMPSTKGLVTLGQVMNWGSDLNAFKSFVYALVLFNAESVATRAGVFVSGSTINKVSKELNGPVVLHHTQPDRAIASLSDRLAARRLRVVGSKIGHSTNVPLLLSSSREFSLFDDITTVMLTLNSWRQPNGVRVTQPLSFQSAATTREGDLDSLGREKSAHKEATPLSKQMAKQILDLAWTLFKDTNLTAEDQRLVWGLVQQMALGSATIRREEIKLPNNLKGLGLEQLIAELSNQLRQMNKPTMPTHPFLANGHLPAMGPVIFHYLNVSALPAQPKEFEKWVDGSEASWIINQLGLTIDQADELFLDAASAKKRAAELEKRVNEPGHFDDVFATLRILAGLYRSDFFTRMTANMKSKFNTMAEVEAALSGQSRDRAAQETALRLLLLPLTRVLIEANNARNPELATSLIEKIDLSIVPTDSLVNGKSQTVEQNGRIQILVGLEEGLTTQAAFIHVVGRLTHELSDVLGNRTLKKYSIGNLGVPTVLSEAWSAHATSQALRWLKLSPIADVLDLETAQRVAELEQAQVYYLLYENVRGNKPLVRSLQQRVKATKGLTQIAIVAGDTDFKAAQIELGASGLLLVSPTQMLRIPTSTGETALEAHARLYLGTRAVKLVMDDTHFKANAELEKLVTTGGRVISELLTILSPIEYNSRIEAIVEDTIRARLVGRQA